MGIEPSRQDGIAALRQRLFFAGELIKLAERELLGDAMNRKGVAMACRYGAALQLHAVMTGFLDDLALRMSLPRAPESLTVPLMMQALSEQGMASPELGRVAGLLATGWLHDCMADVRRCLSATPAAMRDTEPEQDEIPAPGPASNNQAAGRRIPLVVTATVSAIALLSAEDFSRIRCWIAEWSALLDGFLRTLEEY